MKKILIFIMVVILGIMPVIVSAKEYDVDGTDISIEIPDEWHVMTRDNPTCCKEVEAAGIKADEMQEYFIMQKMYLDAVITNENANESIELFIRKNATEEIINLSKSSDEEVEKLVAEFESVYTPDICEEYKNDYTYVYIERNDGGYNLIEFITIVNSEIYSFTFQKVNKFSEEDIENINKIVDSADYTISPEYDTDKDDLQWKKIVVISVIAVIVVSGVVMTVIQYRKKENHNR